MKRRNFIAATSALIFGAINTKIIAQSTSKAFVLRIVRKHGWEELMHREVCVASTVYSVDPDRVLTDWPGQLLCYALELPHRANQQDISAIPNGSYSAFARTSEKNGRVIELEGVPGRQNVQIHTGNSIDNTLGCIILGNTPVQPNPIPANQPSIFSSPNSRCWISGSRDARNKLLAVYGWPDSKSAPPKRPIIVKFETRSS